MFAVRKRAVCDIHTMLISLPRSAIATHTVETKKTGWLCINPVFSFYSVAHRMSSSRLVSPVSRCVVRFYSYSIDFLCVYSWIDLTLARSDGGGNNWLPSVRHTHRENTGNNVSNHETYGICVCSSCSCSMLVCVCACCECLCHLGSVRHLGKTFSVRFFVCRINTKKKLNKNERICLSGNFHYSMCLCVSFGFVPHNVGIL